MENNTYLSPHFSLHEMVKSSMATRHRINNTPSDPTIIKNLKILCTQVLEPARKEYGHPLIITSGYRCPALNTMVGGAACSYHTMGKAADIALSTREQGKRLADALNKQTLTDLVLLETTKRAIWLHVQWSEHPRHKINLDYVPY